MELIHCVQVADDMHVRQYCGQFMHWPLYKYVLPVQEIEHDWPSLDNNVPDWQLKHWVESHVKQLAPYFVEQDWHWIDTLS